ncbi:MAG: universal stress protein, partial [Rhodoglobus sp.]
MTIVIGVDGSGPSRAAMEWGLRRAQALHDTVALVHVVEDEWGQLGAELVAERAHDGALVLAAAVRDARQLSPDLAIEEHLVHGSTAFELAALAESSDLLVVGTHKTGYIRGRVLGTRSISVAFAARCSIAVVPENYLATRRGVVVGITEGNEWASAVSVAAREAAHRGEDLTIVNAGEDEVAGRLAARDLLAHAAAAAREIAPDLTIVSRVSGRRPAEALLDASRGANMLVIGASRRPTSELLGSVAHEVLLNINSPVLIARPE